ncbi:OLC1v1010736C1 [Oldenlandia corymbosa var. corymbosa]|uniref:OLC1v1010736C1 n=1 Tax=Oldenlandia corymbosa var. corymbosa TaxID=529605 RepID=A0AAV1DRZ7_OLDCO|nr:OLC1v1010736C1 [Oldenlandia corymbosa var. corymbosa]
MAEADNIISNDNHQKWTTLVHNGVQFPQPYKPHGVKILYKGNPVDLTPEQEEVATLFAAMLDTEYIRKPRFRHNFFKDWRQILGENNVIQNLEDCDFSPIYEWHRREKDECRRKR